MTGTVGDAISTESKAVVVTAAALDWVEKQATEGLKRRSDNAEIVAKECVTTLTVLFAGMGVAVAYVVKQLEAGAASWLVLPAAVAGIYLMVLAFVLVCKCMMFESFPAIYNSPANLEYGEMDLIMLRRMELRGIQERTSEAVRIVNRRAASLNRIRLAAIGSPLVFILSAVLASLLPGLVARALGAA